MMRRLWLVLVALVVLAAPAHADIAVPTPSTALVCTNGRAYIPQDRAVQPTCPPGWVEAGAPVAPVPVVLAPHLTG